MKASRATIDRTMLLIIGLLLVIGFITLTSASFNVSEHRFGTPYYYVKKQILQGLGLGLILFWLGLKIPVDYYKKYAPYLLIGSLFLTVLVFIRGIGITSGGAARWIGVGPFSFQPSEVLKISFVMYLAAWLAARKKALARFDEGFIPFLIITGVGSFFLILEPDIGTLGVITLTSLLLYAAGGGKRKHIFLAIVLGLIALGIFVFAEDYRRERLLAFFHPEVDPQDTSWHINQALIAIGSGGLFGQGVGLSRQKFQYLPEPASDAIFAVYAEEAGFLGTLFLLALFMAFLLRGMMIAARAKDYFSQLLGVGITLLVIVQVIINIAAISGLFLLTGIPLPFLSFGGTALAFLLFEMGVLLRISRGREA